MKMIESIRSGLLPSPGSLLDSLEEYFPLIGQMEATPQDPEWHGEGNVRVHTEMVVAEVCERFGTMASPEERIILLVGAALHDIGKTLTTRKDEIDGRIRIVSPHHPERGRSYVAPLIGSLGLSKSEVKAILGIIRNHHDWRKLVMRNSGKHLFSRLARCVDLRNLYWLEQCDLQGRVCGDLENELETLELFRLEAENIGLWNIPDPYANWKSFLSGEISNPEELSYALGLAIRDYELGQINSPEEALARTWAHRGNHGSVTILCAPAGAGKSTWIHENMRGNSITISLDDIRVELTGKRSDQSKNGQVLQLGKERLRQALREKKNIAWDSTSLRRDGRGTILGLAHDYHAASRIVALGIPPQTALKQNRARVVQIPTSILEKQYLQWQWPDLWEAHQVDQLFYF